MALNLLLVGGGGYGANSSNTYGGGGGGGGRGINGVYGVAGGIGSPIIYSVTVGSGGTNVAPTGGDTIFPPVGTVSGGGGGGGPGSNGSVPGGGGGGLGPTYGGGSGGSGGSGGNVSNSGIVCGAGGGGAAGNGGNASTTGGGSGGGLFSSYISGSFQVYSGGGGGGGSGFITGQSSGGSGNGGGGNGGSDSFFGSAGAVGGGGGGGGRGNNVGGFGGNGIAIFSYPIDGSYGISTSSIGGIITQSGGNQIHTFVSSGSLSLQGFNLPTVTTQSTTSITPTTATINGNITVDNVVGSNAQERGVVYSTTSRSLPGNVPPASSLYESVVSSSGSFGTGTYTQSITGLAFTTTYYVRAYAKNGIGYAYGNEVSFTTIKTLPTVTTGSVDLISHTTGQGNGNITVVGGELNDKRGFVYSLTAQTLPGNVIPTSSGYTNNVEEIGSFNTGSFTRTMSSLTPLTTYFVRAYSHNSIGYTYGSETTFTTGSPGVAGFLPFFL